MAKVCVLPIGGLCTVETGTIRAVASTEATGGSASYSTAGSTIQSLKIAGLTTPVDLNQTTKIPLSALVFGAGSYVAINERSGPGGGQPTAGLSGGKYAADVTVTMIHVKITGLLGLQAAEVIIAQATAHSDFPQTFVCAPSTRSVSGHAFVAKLSTGPLLADLVQGYTQISPLGGSETEHIAAVKVPANGSAVTADVADTSSVGTLSSTQSTSTSVAEIAGNGTQPACILRTGLTCVATATVVRSESHSTANSSGATSNDSGTKIAGLSVLGIPINVTATPNSTISLPGIGFIILNEQFCDGGALASHTCSGTTHSGLTIRAIRIVVTAASNLLGLNPGIELVVAEAHSDATFS